MGNKVALDLTNIRNFLDTVIYERHASSEEVFNCLTECLKQVFALNCIDIKKYVINLHSVKKMEEDNDAFMTYDHKTNIFDVYFQKKYMVLKNSSTENMEGLLSLIYNALHEYAHIMQYIKYPELMADYDNEKNTVYENMVKIVNNSSPKNARVLIREYMKHADAKRIISSVEKDANNQAYKYFKLILNCLLKDEFDPNLRQFYLDIINYINNIRKDEFYNYRIQNKLNKQALSILEGYNIQQEDLITF